MDSIDFFEPFIVRAPTRSVDDFLAWSDGTKARTAYQDQCNIEAAIDHDYTLLARTLFEYFRQDSVRIAIRVASPSLHKRLEHLDPTQVLSSKKNRKLLNSLVRYFTRMTTRPTPFGLFSALSLGTFGNRTETHFSDKITFRCRLDDDVITSMVKSTNTSKNTAHYYPNPSIHKVGESYFYYSENSGGERSPFRLLSIKIEPWVCEVLHRARTGISRTTLQEILRKQDGGMRCTSDEVGSAIDDIIDNQFLCSAAFPTAIGAEPLTHIENWLGNQPALERQYRSSATLNRILGQELSSAKDLAKHI